MTDDELAAIVAKARLSVVKLWAVSPLFAHAGMSPTISMS